MESGLAARSASASRVDEELEEAGLLKDFTSASEWEVFVHRLGEILVAWNDRELLKPIPRDVDLRSGVWMIEEEPAELGHRKFDFVLCRVELPKSEPGEAEGDGAEEEEEPPFGELCRSERDFPCGAMLPRASGDRRIIAGARFGLGLFAVLCPREYCGPETHQTLLSSLSVALTDAETEAPALAMFGERSRGLAYRSGVALSLETAFLPRASVHRRHFRRLVDVYDLFKGKISPTEDRVPSTVSAESAYRVARTRLPELSDRSPGEREAFAEPPFGFSSETIDLSFYATWTDVNVDNVVELEWCSDFDPGLADRWAVELRSPKCPVGRLQSFYGDFLRLAEVRDRVTELLPDVPMTELMAGPSGVPVMRTSTFEKEKVSLKPFLCENFGDVSPVVVERVLEYAFSEDSSETSDDVVDCEFAVKTDSLKAGTPDDILWRLACSMASLSKGHSKYNIMAHIWYEFVQELRYRWQNVIGIPRVMDGYPNSRTCLLHQKLQMLNICIDRKRKRDEAAMRVDQSSESGEEFYECQADEDVEEDYEDSGKYPPWDKPVGRLSKFGNLKLIETGDPMYIPITQEPVPKTEDQLEMDAQVILNFGEDEQHSDTVKKIMSASMLSDMESFKAANPGATFADFIRWYSPRDWIEEEELDDYGQKKGHLSNRMVIPDNIWLEVWKVAQKVPAKRQGRLFDDTREAEKILHFLEISTISQVVELILPSLTHVIITKLAERCRNKPELPKLKKIFDRLMTCATRLTRENCSPSEYTLLNTYIYEIETSIVTANTLRNTLKIDPADNDEETVKFLEELLSGNRVDVCAKVDALKIVLENKVSMSSSSTNIPEADAKEFVLRAVASRPSSVSRPCIQMMRVKIHSEGYDITSAFTEDSIFY